MDTTATARVTDEDETSLPVDKPKRKRAPKAKSKSSSAKPDAPDAPDTLVTSDLTITLPIADMRAAVARLIRVVDCKSVMPMLQRVSVRADAGKVRIAATDLTTSLTVELHGHTSTGAVTLEAKRLRDLLRVLPDGDVTLAHDTGKHVAMLAVAQCDAKLDAISERDFPSIPDHMGFGWHAIDGGVLKGMIEDTIDSVCHDETRFHLNGIYLECVDGERVRMVSTDGHRLTRSTRPCKTTFTTRTTQGEIMSGAILPHRACRELRALLSEGPAEIAMDIKGHVFVRQGDWTLCTKRIDAPFPSYEQVIPRESRFQITAGRDDLSAACKRSLVIATETRGVILEARGGMLRVEVSDGDGGELAQKIVADYGHKTEGKRIGVNPKFLMASLATMEGEHVVVTINNELDPIMIRSIDDAAMRSLDDAELLVVVMPMRI